MEEMRAVVDFLQGRGLTIEQVKKARALLKDRRMNHARYECFS